MAFAYSDTQEEKSRCYNVANENHIERKWKEARLFRTGPISNNLVLAQVARHMLGMPRSY